MQEGAAAGPPTAPAGEVPSSRRQGAEAHLARAKTRLCLAETKEKQRKQKDSGKHIREHKSSQLCTCCMVITDRQQNQQLTTSTFYKQHQWNVSSNATTEADTRQKNESCFSEALWTKRDAWRACKGQSALPTARRQHAASPSSHPRWPDDAAFAYQCCARHLYAPIGK